jgi:hypothetical protein
MNFAIAASTILCLGAPLALFLLVRRAAFAGGQLPVTAEWIEELSTERYRPMLRLLDSSDLEFLRSQPGFNPRLGRRLRFQRCQIFRGYLRCLNADFQRVCAAIKLLMMQSRHDRPDLARVLVHHQMTFAFGMLMIQCRMVLYLWGICGVDVSNLVKIFDLMRLELRALAPTPVALGA